MQQTQTPWWKKISVQQFFSRGGEFRRDARLSWNAIIALFFLGTTLSLAVGYFTYYSAVRAENMMDSSIVPRSALRAENVKAVIDTYQQKKDRFTAILADQPTFLSPGKGAVVPVKEETPTASTTTSTSTEGS